MPNNTTATTTTTTTTTSINTFSLSATSSSAEIAQQIKRLLREKQKPALDERGDAARLDELRRLFAYLVQRGDLEWLHHIPTTTRNSNTRHNNNNSNNVNPITKKWKELLQQQHKKMVQQLCRRIQQGKSTAMRTMWGVLASSPKSITTSNNNHVVIGKVLSTDLVYQWIRAMTTAASIKGKHQRGTTSVMMMPMEFLQPYRDVQHQTLLAITRLALEQRRSNHNEGEGGDDPNELSTNNGKISAERLVQLLLMIPTPATQEEMDESQYLFPPPAIAATSAATNGSVMTLSGENEDLDDSGADDDDDDSSQQSSENSSDSDDDEEQENTSRPTKRLKQGSSFSTNKNKSSKTASWDFTQAKRHRRALSRAWLAVLQLPLPTSALKQVLVHLPTQVLPVVGEPLRFADFFLQAYDLQQQQEENSSNNMGDSGMISILALEGLFLLITQHGLEYANFYHQLYRLIATPQLFQVKFRTRFLQLLDKCLCRNDKLPSQIVAAFIKRLCGTALLAPPASILFVLALCSNLLQQHQECIGLIHRAQDNNNSSDGRYDVFDNTTNDPSRSNALQSSLWELHALERHYHPAVATMAQSIGRYHHHHDNKNKNVAPLHDLPELLKLTYQALLEQEHQHATTQRKRKKPVPLTFVAPTSLLGLDRQGQDIFASVLMAHEK